MGLREGYQEILEDTRAGTANTTSVLIYLLV